MRNSHKCVLIDFLSKRQFSFGKAYGYVTTTTTIILTFYCCFDNHPEGEAGSAGWTDNPNLDISDGGPAGNAGRAG